MRDHQPGRSVGGAVCGAEAHASHGDKEMVLEPLRLQFCYILPCLQWSPWLCRRTTTASPNLPPPSHRALYLCALHNSINFPFRTHAAKM